VCVCVTTTHVHCIGVEVLLQLARQPEMKSKSNELPLSSCCKCVLHQREPVRAGAFSSSSLFVLILLFRPPTCPPLASPSPFTCITCRRFRVSVSVAMQQRHLQLATFPFVIARFRWGLKAVLGYPSIPSYCSG